MLWFNSCDTTQTRHSRYHCSHFGILCRFIYCKEAASKTNGLFFMIWWYFTKHVSLIWLGIIRSVVQNLAKCIEQLGLRRFIRTDICLPTAVTESCFPCNTQ